MGFNLNAVTQPNGIIQLLEVLFGCVTFSIVAAKYPFGFNSNWLVWCMFVWCFCFAATVIILSLEISGLHSKIPKWEQIVFFYVVTACLSYLTTAVIFPVYIFQKGGCSIHFESCQYHAAASVFACLTFILYTVQSFLLKGTGKVSGYVTTPPGILKILQAFVACVIFGIVDQGRLYKYNEATQWSIFVFCFCFIVTVVILILESTGLSSKMGPVPFPTLTMAYSVLAIVLYLTATVLWPVYLIRNGPNSFFKDNNICVAFFSCLNTVLYIVDAVLSFLKCK